MERNDRGMKKWMGFDVYECGDCLFSTLDKEEFGRHLRVNKHNPKYYPKMEEKPEKPVYAISEEPEYKVLSYVPEESVEEPKVIRRGRKKIENPVEETGEEDEVRNE